MNTSHYPSLELCKKLTEIGFPETTEFIIDDTKRIKKFSEVIVEYQGHYYDKIVRITKQGEYLCPSVMEMLDVMPDTIAQEYLLRFWKNNDRQYGVVYQEVNGNQIGECGKGFETLPNALAEMILWLHENNYINFK